MRLDFWSRPHDFCGGKRGSNFLDRQIDAEDPYSFRNSDTLFLKMNINQRIVMKRVRLHGDGDAQVTLYTKLSLHSVH